MIMTEKHHAHIVLAFYRELKNRKGKYGIEIFRFASRMYGEERGRRMALRALRDGCPLNFDTYFAYSEWEATEGAFDVTMEARTGYIEEKVFKCPWAEVFREESCIECGLEYCREIDRSIVRGFNPDLSLDMPKVQYQDGCCQFFFRDQSVTEKCFENGEKMAEHAGGPILLPFSYHCGHVYTTFSRVVGDTLLTEGEECIRQIRSRLEGCFGKELVDCLEHYKDQNFNFLP